METERDIGLGVISTVLCILFYGSAFTPIKMFDGGDGIFVQWMMTVGQMAIPGLAVLVRSNFPPLVPYAMIGGMLYSIANCCTVFIMSHLGMTMGPLLWNTTGCLVGWAVANFGLFGLHSTIAHHPVINICGVATVLIGGALFTFVRNTPTEGRRNRCVVDKEWQKEKELEPVETPEKSGMTRTLCIILALFLGLIYGNLLTPISVLVQRDGGNVEDYLFSHFFGAFLVSTAVFITYSQIRRNRPIINPEITCPALLSGALFGAGEIMFFIGNHHLTQVIAFPIVSMCPGLINSMWGVLLFKEIRGRDNLILLGTAYCITLIGTTLIGVSKVPF